MTMDSLGVIRRGWQEVAATVAPHVAGLADLLEKRLGEAQRLGTLDEASLLAIVDAATQLAANSGAVEVAPTLSKRLRRRVYEYLLSLDAARDSRSEPVAPPEDSVEPRLREDDLAGQDSGEPLIGADEVAALGGDGREGVFASLHRSPAGSPGEGSMPEGEGREPTSPPSATAPVPDIGSGEMEGGSGSAPPRFGFHIGDPDDMLAASPPAQDHGGNGTSSVLPDFAPLDAQPPAPLTEPRHTSFGDPSTWPKPIAPQLRGSRGNGAGPTREAATPVAADGQPPSSTPASRSFAAPPARAGRSFGAPPAAEGERPMAGQSGDSLSEASTEVAATATPGLPDEGPETWVAAPGLAGTSQEASSAPPWAGAFSPEAVALDRERALEPFALSTVDTESPPVDPVSEKDLADLRRSVEERLRKKRCDDVASLLQQAAQDLGGEVVAGIALDAGDRCRSLGRRNAALNCYLAASRADPVFEPPLARLADICIDDQDVDLAVSYLERIARLTRLRGDQRGALRIYRKIAAIAPYRDDVLETLMRAAESGRID